jgi:hypothetical protein
MNAWFSLLAAGLASGAADTTTWVQHHPGVYASSQEYSHNQPAYPGTVSPLAPAAKYVEVVQAHTHAVHRVPLAQVWGYATAHGQAFRLVEHKAYAIQPQQNNLFTYSRQRAIQHSRSLHTITEHFYSETLDGPLHPLTKRGLKQRAAAR